MSIYRFLFFLIGSILAFAVAYLLTGNPDFMISDRLAGFYVEAQTVLPISLRYDEFLLLLTIAAILVTILVLAAAALSSGWVALRMAAVRHTSWQQSRTEKHSSEAIRAQITQGYHQFLEISEQLNKKLDKHALVQTLVRCASKTTSAAHANSAVSLWLLHIETDTIRYERGLYCDETMFTNNEFQPTEQPFARVMQSRKPIIVDDWKKELTILKEGQASKLGSTTSMLVVPLVIEESVLGIMLIFCDPETVKRYQEEGSFFDAVWGELTLALAIAVQGELAILDRLTGVYNREYFMKRLIQELDRANRFQFPLTLLMLDIDNFKAVNDTLGHQQGDAVLRIVAKVLKSEVRAIDLAGRYGGEEFIIMCPETGFGDAQASTNSAKAVSERIRASIEEEFAGFRDPLAITVSIGVMVRRYPQDREVDHMEFIRIVDEQLYKAKTTGKNKVCYAVTESERTPNSAQTPENPQSVSG